ncbi:hypothetical protein EAH72_10860 [Pseudomonas caspiana]|nr:hypothetical protein [Pseudomonas caspiana]TPG96710.1 hypothetical protein EAH72_10860 [Pseudomonas caspiana]
MSEQTVTANHNFIVNGDFKDQLREPWEVDDFAKVTIATEQWNGVETRHLRLVNEGTATQRITLARRPKPEEGRADYRLSFLYQATQGAVCMVKISSGMSGGREEFLDPSRLGELERGDESEEPFDLDLTRRAYFLNLKPEETTITITFISPKNDQPWMTRGLRVTQVMIELVLEDLILESWTLDGLVHAPDDPLRLCFGATGEDAFAFTMSPTVGSVWNGTEVGLLVNEQTTDPTNMIGTSPRLGSEQSIAETWLISCADAGGDEEDIESVLNVRSRYTAPIYSIPVLMGNYRLDVVAVREAAYYPVVDLEQKVGLTVRVESHYTKRPMANREVTWTLKGPSAKDDSVLLRQLTDGEGEASYTYTPDKEGEYEIVASVDSHYKKEDARYAFKVRALKADPWLSATFSLDGPSHSWTWGEQTAYPCRGATHEVTLAFPTGHALADTDLALHWAGDDTPEGLGVTFEPRLDALTPITGLGLKWKMVCENKKNSHFEFSVRCSKLLEPSPLQTLALAHNSLALGQVKQSSRFPAVGGADLQLEVQILSQVPNVGGVSGVDVRWSIKAPGYKTLQTGEDGWCVYTFEPLNEGELTITAQAASPYDGSDPKHEFDITVYPENPWNKLVTVTLDSREEGRVGLLCFRDAEPVELVIMPVDDNFLDEDIYLELRSAGDSNLGFCFDPPMDERRQLTEKGLTWKVHSTSEISARFQLNVCHTDFLPFELQGRLLSKTLEEEGTFKLDGNELAFGSTVYPCLGGVHTLLFTPNSSSLLIGLEVAAKLADASSHALNLELEPKTPQTLMSEGVVWTLDGSDSTESGMLGLSLELNQAGFTFPAVPMSLGHNRVKIAGVRNPFDPEVGQTVTLELKATSHYTELAVANVEVSFEHGDTSTPSFTESDGWAKFVYPATQPGDDSVIATVQSPYYEPDKFPSYTFEIKVIAAGTEESGTRVSTSTTQTKEG